jgi:hypothetical protein
MQQLDLCPFCVELVKKGPAAGDSTAIAHHSREAPAAETSSSDTVTPVVTCAFMMATSGIVPLSTSALARWAGRYKSIAFPNPGSRLPQRRMGKGRRDLLRKVTHH